MKQLSQAAEAIGHIHSEKFVNGFIDCLVRLLDKSVRWLGHTIKTKSSMKFQGILKDVV